jgi:hypothetical protein
MSTAGPYIFFCPRKVLGQKLWEMVTEHGQFLHDCDLAFQSKVANFGVSSSIHQYDLQLQVSVYDALPSTAVHGTCHLCGRPLHYSVVTFPLSVCSIMT